LDQVRATLLATSPVGYIACCAAVRDMDQRQAVSAIRQPTLVISGAEDQATPPADGRFLAEQITGADDLELAAAHLSNIEEVDGHTDAEAVKNLTWSMT
jgi:3-oxoadipate enol-lactonase